MIIATAGHVDHGKTSLVKALTGTDTDQLEEEKARGLTITPGFAYIDTETDTEADTGAGARLGFVDVPGHIRFISNMLASVAAVDLALLVIAADDGIMPQTIEHLQILDLLGVKVGMVALTKIDRVADARVTEVTRDVEGLLADAAIYPVSATEGEGVSKLMSALVAAAAESEERSAQGMFRLAIDRRFNVKGSGLVVTGSVFSGRASIGDELLLMPAGEKVRVRGLHTQNQAAAEACAGERCAMNLASQLQLEDIHRGNWITANPAPASSRIDAEIRLLGPPDKPLRHWTPVHLHVGANHVTARVAILQDGWVKPRDENGRLQPDQLLQPQDAQPQDGSKRHGGPARIHPGETGLVQLVLDAPINVCLGDRLILRDQSALATLGGGTVLWPDSPRRGRAKPERLAFLAQIDVASPARTLERLLAHQGLVDSRALALAFNLDEAEMASLIHNAIHNKRSDASQLGGLIVTGRHEEQRQAELVSQMDEWHRQNQGKAGLPINQVKRQFCQGWPEALADAIIERLLEAGELQQSGNIIGRPGFSTQMSEAARQAWQKAEPLLRENIMRPPVLHDLAKTMDMPPDSLAKMLDEAVKLGVLVRPLKNRYFVPEGVDALKALVVQVSEAEGRFTVQQYRDATGIGRNLSIEILEHFDRTGVTRRIGDVRELMVGS